MHLKLTACFSFVLCQKLLFSGKYSLNGVSEEKAFMIANTPVGQCKLPLTQGAMQSCSNFISKKIFRAMKRSPPARSMCDTTVWRLHRPTMMTWLLFWFFFQPGRSCKTVSSINAWFGFMPRYYSGIFSELILNIGYASWMDGRYSFTCLSALTTYV